MQLFLIIAVVILLLMVINKQKSRTKVVKINLNDMLEDVQKKAKEHKEKTDKEIEDLEATKTVSTPELDKIFTRIMPMATLICDYGMVSDNWHDLSKQDIYTLATTKGIMMGINHLDKEVNTKIMKELNEVCRVDLKCPEDELPFINLE